MPDDDRTRELDISAWLPAQRATGKASVSSNPVAATSKHVAPEADEVFQTRLPTGDPSWRHSDETLLLPVFVTGGAAAEPEVEKSPAPAAAPVAGGKPQRDRLPSDERNMLIFVTMLLALGTLAIVAMASVGR